MQPTPPPEPRPVAATSSGAGAGSNAVRSAPIKAREAAAAAAREKLALEAKLVRIEQEHRDRQLAQVAAWQEETKAQTVRAPWLVCPWRTAQRCARDSPAACVDVRRAVPGVWVVVPHPSPLWATSRAQQTSFAARLCAALRCCRALFASHAHSCEMRFSLPNAGAAYSEAVAAGCRSGGRGGSAAGARDAGN